MGATPTVLGLPFIGPVPAGDRASQVLTGTFAAAGPGMPIAMMGPFNIAIWGSINTALTTTNGSSAYSVASGSGLAAGVSVSSIDIPVGVTLATLTGTTGNLAFPTYQLPGRTSVSIAEYGAPVIKDLARTTSLLGATVTGPGIPSATTVTSILQAHGVNPDGSEKMGVVQISNTPTSANPLNRPKDIFSFALSNKSVASGTDSAAVFVGAGVTFSGTVQVERSFDGGSTWLVANVGGAGTLAVFTAGTPVNLAFGEPELGVLYRLNCTVYTSGTINYRISGSGAATMALSYNQLA